MSDDMWRRADKGSGRHDDNDIDDTDEAFDDFGELTFADDSDDTSTGMVRPVDPTPRARPSGGVRRPAPAGDFSGEIEFADEGSAPIRFGPSDTGPLPHWTEPPTGEMPRIFEGDAPTGRTRETRRDDSSGARRSPRGRDVDDSDVDIWGSYSGAAPRPVLDEPAPRRRRDVPTDEIPVRASRDDSSRGMFDDTNDDFDDFGDLTFSDEGGDDTSASMRRPSGDPSGGRPRIKLGEPTGGSRAERGSGPLRRSDVTSPSSVSTTPMPTTRRNQSPRDPSFGDSGFIGSGDDDSGFPDPGYDDFSGGARGRSGRPSGRTRPSDTADTGRSGGRGRPVIGDDTFGDESMGRPVPGRGRPPRDPRAGRGPGGPAPRGPRDPRRGGPVAPPGGTAGRDMPSAVAVGLLLAAAFIGALMWKPVAVLAIVVLVTGLASIEFFDKVTEKGYRPASVVGITMAVAAPLAVYWVGDMALPMVMVFALIAAGATFVGASSIHSNPLPNMAVTALGMMWIGMTGSYGALLAGVSNTPFLPHIGTDTLLMVAVGVVANDVGALFVGSAAGSTPLRPWISPNKTTEGLMGGTVATFLAMWVVGLQSDTWNDISEIVVLALAVAVLAPLGDLVESMFKRNLEVKDFGSLIKGHGGVLDRFDGFLFVLPAAYYLLMVLEPYAS